MPRVDKYHSIVKESLIQEGWTITHDPYIIEYDIDRLFIDLGAEKLIGAELNNQKIAVEVKSFLKPSVIREFEESLGQYKIYEALLEEIDPDRYFKAAGFKLEINGKNLV